jgi:poly(hydroxyalkanoate) granule-associated protein
MVTNSKKPTDDNETAAQLAEQLKASAQEIWLAGLGALAKAQEEGGKMFDALVKQGAELQHKTQAKAGDRFAEASSRVTGMAADFSAKAGERLEGIVDSRLARALERLGVPDGARFEELAARVEDLERKLAKTAAPRRRAARTEPKPAAPRARRRDGG